MSKRGYSPDQAAAYLGIAESKVKAHIRAAKLPARYDGKDIILEQTDLDAYLDSLPTERA